MTCAALLWLSLWAHAPPARSALQEEPDTRFFAIPMSRDARELAATTQEHLAAGRFEEGVEALQSLIEGHRGEVLPEEWRGNRDQGSSIYDAHPGAAEWARAQLFQLPAEARALYLDRHEMRAAEALARALQRPSRLSLVEVPRRWPIAPSAARAWRCLGDLELESGQPSAALLSWARAEEVERCLGRSPPDGARAELARKLAADEREESARGVLPRSDAQPWSTTLELAPFARRNVRGVYRYNLFPVLCRDRVLVSSTLKLYARDAYSGERLWEAGPPEGWSQLSKEHIDELFEGIHEQTLVAPGCGGAVALAALQIPFSENLNEEWQGIEIMRAIPERRLFAYDLETGRTLWNHAPQLTWDAGHGRWTWDGTSGSYAQRMMVAAPPTVSGSRVLVPCYRERGRIDYHVACYELESGELLWSTPVVSGQRERNMFGRAKREFAASPLAVEGDRVIAQTELGTVAALDLLTGRILWQSLYRQIDLPKTRSYNTPEREATWRLAPPVVAGGLVICTPFDSKELVAFRLEDGSAHWAYSEEQLRRLDRDTEHLEFNLLLGADVDTVYLAGAKISALQKPGGLDARSPFVARWTEPLPREHEPADRSPRAVLCKDSVLVHTSVERIALDRRTGARLAHLSGHWNRVAGGNAWVEDGILFTLSEEKLSGFFDWDALLERARLVSERSPRDAGAWLSTGELFLRRGLLTLEQEDLELALDSLRQARSFFERLLAAAGPEGRVDSLPRVQEDQLRCLRALAEIHGRQGDLRGALQILQDARALPAAGLALRDLLLQEERCVRDLDPERRLAVLDELLERCPGLPAPEELWSVGSDGLPAWLAPEPPGTGSSRSPLTLGLWVRLERSRERTARGELELALEDLHEALSRHGELELAPGTSVAALVRRLIARVLALPGARAAYAGFEERAQELYMTAHDSGDPARLEEVAARYPHSRAAELAMRERLERAVEADDVHAVAAIVCSALRTSAQTSAAEALLLLRLARALGRNGNTTFERALLADLARESPDTLSDLPEHEGRSLAALARDLSPEEPEPVSPPPRFDARVVSAARASEGSHEFLGALPQGALPQESAPRALHAYLASDRILVYSSEDPGTPLWSHLLPGGVEAGEAGCALASGRVLFVDRAGVHALDELGREAWSRPTGDDPVRRLVVHGGVLVANLSSGRVLAFDVQQGIPLWEHLLGEAGNWSGPVAGDGRLVFFSQRHALPTRALVIDLFRGRVSAEFELPALDTTGSPELTCWIERERLIVPAFTRRSPSLVSAFSLETGQRAWSFEFRREQELFALVRSEGKDYAVTVGSRGSGTGNGGIYLLDLEFGSPRLVVPLKEGEEPMGLVPGSRTVLSSPYLFTYASSPAERVIPVRAIHLPYGQLWTWALPVAPDEFYDNRGLPMPAVSADCVALAFQSKGAPGASRGGEWTLVFLDKRAPIPQGRLVLSENFVHARTLELHGLGEALFVVGKGSAARGLRLEILERMR